MSKQQPSNPIYIIIQMIIWNNNAAKAGHFYPLSQSADPIYVSTEFSQS